MSVSDVSQVTGSEAQSSTPAVDAPEPTVDDIASFQAALDATERVGASSAQGLPPDEAAPEEAAELEALLNPTADAEDAGGGARVDPVAAEEALPEKALALSQFVASGGLNDPRATREFLAEYELEGPVSVRSLFSDIPEAGVDPATDQIVERIDDSLLGWLSEPAPDTRSLSAEQKGDLRSLGGLVSDNGRLSIERLESVHIEAGEQELQQVTRDRKLKHIKTSELGSFVKDHVAQRQRTALLAEATRVTAESVQQLEVDVQQSLEASGLSDADAKNFLPEGVFDAFDAAGEFLENHVPGWDISSWSPDEVVDMISTMNTVSQALPERGPGFPVPSDNAPPPDGALDSDWKRFADEMARKSGNLITAIQTVAHGLLNAADTNSPFAMGDVINKYFEGNDRVDRLPEHRGSHFAHAIELGLENGLSKEDALKNAAIAHGLATAEDLQPTEISEKVMELKGAIELADAEYESQRNQARRDFDNSQDRRDNLAKEGLDPSLRDDPDRTGPSSIL